MGGVDEALDDDVIDDGAAGAWWSNGSGDELLIAVAAFVFDDIVDDDEEEDGKICSAWLPFNDAGPVWSSIMRLAGENSKFSFCFYVEKWKKNKTERMR